MAVCSAMLVNCYEAGFVKIVNDTGNGSLTDAGKVGNYFSVYCNGSSFMGEYNDCHKDENEGVTVLFEKSSHAMNESLIDMFKFFSIFLLFLIDNVIFFIYSVIQMLCLLTLQLGGFFFAHSTLLLIISIFSIYFSNLLAFMGFLGNLFI